MAGGTMRRGKRRMMNEINVVPYIDVMLVLLVIFMVTAPLVTPGTIDLPTVDKASLPPEKPVEVIVKADGSYGLREDGRDRNLGRNDLSRIAAELANRNPQPPVVISADKTVKYEAVLNAMDELRKQNIKRVGLTVKPAR